MQFAFLPGDLLLLPFPCPLEIVQFFSHGRARLPLLGVENGILRRKGINSRRDKRVPRELKSARCSMPVAVPRRKFPPLFSNRLQQRKFSEKSLNDPLR